MLRSSLANFSIEEEMLESRVMLTTDDDMAAADGLNFDKISKTEEVEEISKLLMMQLLQQRH